MRATGSTLPTWQALEDAFWAQGGKPKPPVTFEHEGRRWTRHATRYPSNSGKTAQWSASFTSDNGERVSDPHPPIRNRRNDPNRNWGLGSD